jgi:eukaryotic-like serine/threonine-protein kinase
MLEPGTTLAHYRIASKIGEGAMGVVYEAHDTRLPRSVALKVLPADKLADATRKQRFVQEAKAASALNHPNIVTIHDIGSADGVDFIVMEHVVGKTLEQLIPPNGMAPSLVTGYGVQIADALSKAHAVGIVHRDLKPSNIMVTNEGRIKILDFGIAKLLYTPASPFADVETTLALTDQGIVVGTTPYMSPEQAEGNQVDPRSDIFSFGSILYELVSGRRLFAGKSRLDVLAKIRNEDPTPPSAIVASISPDLEKVILRCLRKDPARRYQTMADLKVALEDVESQPSTVVSTAKKPTSILSTPFRVAAAALAVLLVAGYAAWLIWRTPQMVEPLRAVALTTFPGQELYPSISPDGKQVAFSWNGPKQDNFDIYIQIIGSGAPLQLTTHPERDYNAAWSPDGRWIAFLRANPQSSRSELRIVPPLRGPERKLGDIRMNESITLPVFLAWCPDSTCVVVTDSPSDGGPDALFLLSLETGEKRQLTAPEPPAVGDNQPAFSPNGRWLVFRRNITGGLTGELQAISFGERFTPRQQSIRLTVAALDGNYPTWTPDSEAVIFSARERLWKIAVPGPSQPQPLPFVGEDGIMATFSAVRNGSPTRLVYVRRFVDTNIWRVDTQDANGTLRSSPLVAISSTRQDSNPQFSPDAMRVAFVSNRSGDAEIWIADVDGANAFQLTAMGAPATGTPRWSPDGQQIVFNSNLEGHWVVYVVPASGGRPRRLTSGPASDGVPSFSHDGQWIYFSSNRTGQFQIWKVPAAGGNAVQVTHNIGYVAFESPDGMHVYYTQTLAEPSALWRVPVAGGQPAKVVDGVVWRNFVVLERGIYYIDRESSTTRLQFFDFATERVTTAAAGLGDVRYGLTASPDGRTVLYTRVDSTTDDLMLVENFR